VLQKFTARERIAACRRWDIAFGRTLKAFREARGWDQQDLADRMGWRTRVTIAKLETGRRPVKSCESRLLAQVLDVKHDDMMKITETWFAIPEASNPIKPDQLPKAKR
jgi:transcriptional regulator with XRE-family HTH domain